MLLEPLQSYTNYIERSAHFLNCPKHMFNHELDCAYRQGALDNKSLELVIDMLKYFNYPSPVENAKKFVEARSKMSMQEFNKLNVNFETIPVRLLKRNESISNWIKENTTYYFNGIVNSVPSYPFQSRFK